MQVFPIPATFVRSLGLPQTPRQGPYLSSSAWAISLVSLLGMERTVSSNTWFAQSCQDLFYKSCLKPFPVSFMHDLFLLTPGILKIRQPNIFLSGLYKLHIKKNAQETSKAFLSRKPFCLYIIALFFYVNLHHIKPDVCIVYVPLGKIYLCQLPYVILFSVNRLSGITILYRASL